MNVNNHIILNNHIWILTVNISKQLMTVHNSKIHIMMNTFILRKIPNYVQFVMKKVMKRK